MSRCIHCGNENMSKKEVEGLDKKHTLIKYSCKCGYFGFVEKDK